MSNWPTAPIDLSQFDSDLDVPPRDQILAMAEALNAMIAAGQGAGLVRVQRWTTAGTYTFTRHADAKWVIVDLQGAGGRGMVPANSGANMSAFGGAGGAGGFIRVLFLGNFETASLVVGDYAKPPGSWNGTDGSNVLRGGSTQFFIDGFSRFAQGAGGFGGSVSAPSAVVPRVEQVFGNGGDTSMVSNVSADQVLLRVYGQAAEACVLFHASLARIGQPGNAYGVPAAGDEYGSVGRMTLQSGCGGRGMFSGIGQTTSIGPGYMDASNAGAATIWELG
jgi:hypothetical protein